MTYGRTVTNMPGDISALAAQFGLSWGGNWKNKKDPMHFEAVRSMEDVAAANQATEQQAQDREAEAQAAQDQQDAIDGVVSSLQFEGQQIGRTAEQQELYNRLKEAGLPSTAGRTIDPRPKSLHSTRNSRRWTPRRPRRRRQRAPAGILRHGEGSHRRILHDMKDGVQPLDALSRALDRLTDCLLDLTLDTLFTSTGGTTIIASMFGCVGSSSLSSREATGDAGGIVHPREFVIRASQVGKHRNLLEASQRQSASRIRATAV